MSLCVAGVVLLSASVKYFIFYVPLPWRALRGGSLVEGRRVALAR